MYRITFAVADKDEKERYIAILKLMGVDSISTEECGECEKTFTFEDHIEYMPVTYSLQDTEYWLFRMDLSSYLGSSLGNLGLEDELIQLNILTEDDYYDSDSLEFYSSFDTEEASRQFIDRLNEWVGGGQCTE